MTRTINKREVPGLAEYDLEVPSIRFPATIGIKSRMTDEDLFKIVTSKHAREGNDLRADDLFFFPAEISNQNMDSYFTKMSRSSLKNYAEDATTGVTFLNSHKNREQGIGRVMAGEFVDGELPRVFADIYTVRGLKLNADLDTDNFIKGVQTGLIKDVSIGFKEGEDYREECALCGNTYWSYECRHCAGIKYKMVPNPSLDPEGQVEEMRLAFIWIKGARLSEVSAVSDGATPDAMILTKAIREIRAGRMTREDRRFLEGRYHVDLSESRRVFRGYDKDELEDPNKTERSDKIMEETAEQKQAREEKERKAAEAIRINEFLKTQLRKVAEIAGVEVKSDSTEEDILNGIRAKLEDTLPKAKQAEDLRASMVDEVIESAKRAEGKEFKEDNETKLRTKLGKLDLSEIREEGERFTAIGDKTFKKGGRTSAEATDEDLEDDEEDETRADPKYKTRRAEASIVPPGGYGGI